jgi:hypothetical protein
MLFLNKKLTLEVFSIEVLFLRVIDIVMTQFVFVMNFYP